MDSSFLLENAIDKAINGTITCTYSITHDAEMTGMGVDAESVQVNIVSVYKTLA